MHLAVADGRGRVWGGHLPGGAERGVREGCVVFTTVEVAVLAGEEVVF